MLKSFFLTVTVFGGALFGMFVLVWVRTPIPDSTQPMATAQGSVYYYRDGKTVLAREGVDRKPVKLDKVPKAVRQAVIAAENRDFYKDAGVSVSGTLRAVWSTITGKRIEGGSTITQQMVRNYYSGLSQERTLSRKLKEVMVAIKVDQSKSKDWVFEQYLNTIYFGRGAYGIQSAAQAYFRKDVGALTVSEGAYLAAVIQQPSYFSDPKGDALRQVRQRWEFVIDGMQKIGALQKSEAQQLVFPVLKKPKAPLSLSGQKGYMLAEVRKELNTLGYSDEQINQGNLKVTTTFDKDLMEAAERAVKAVRPENTPAGVRTGLAAVDPGTGEVVAFYGGRDYTQNQYDAAFSAQVQAGSTFKTYALAAALDHGLDLGTRLEGNSPLMIGSTPIRNSGNMSYGSVDLVQATRSSINTAYVDLGRKVGLSKIVAAAKAAGIPADQLARHARAATLPLGVASVSAVQQAAAYGTFAAEGIHRTPHVIRSVTDATGKTTKTSVAGKRAFPAQVAADTTYALRQVVEAGTGTSARLYDRPAAGKTGTASDTKSLWFVGYTPQLSVAVTMFRDDFKTVSIPGYGDLYGGQIPARTWRSFMAEAMKGEPVEDFPEHSAYSVYVPPDPSEEPSAPGFDDPSGESTPWESETGTPGDGTQPNTPPTGPGSGEDGTEPGVPDARPPGTERTAPARR
ncbi:transglycosylase domain-containing protein [Rhizohabitans arisaemae]|uniref:transglycosylase domain-containing protein n=1 Tax=Rhizohabitans arisaemae TaxID=2720610 RepID=UPI0024B0650B|nr:transglycosylase domain-containing protein [Rhizohabitans arisaemae]